MNIKAVFPVFAWVTLVALAVPARAMPTEWVRSTLDNQSSKEVTLRFLGGQGAWHTILLCRLDRQDAWKTLARNATFVLKAKTKYCLRMDQDEEVADITFSMTSPTGEAIFHYRKGPHAPEAFGATAKRMGSLRDAHVAINLAGLRNPDGGALLTVTD